MKTLLEKIESLFGISVSSFFQSYSSFLSSDLQNLINYYKGYTESNIEDSKKVLDSLLLTSQKISEKIEIYKESMIGIDYFNFLEEFEDIVVKLESYSRLDKWINKRSYLSVEYILGKNESLESASAKLGYTDRDSGALELALENLLKETDFSLKGGGYFKVNFQNENQISSSHVIGISSDSTSLLGIDISSKLEFIDGEDLKVLTPVETFENSCSILLKLKTGDNPEFPYEGIDKTLLTNKSTSATSFPIILRQLSSLIATDDTIRKMTVEEIFYEKDSLNLKCLLTSILSNYKISTEL